MSKLAANATLVIAVIAAVLSLLSAFNVPISPDQHTAILGVVSAALAILGIYFHPAIPLGRTSAPPA